MAASTTTTALTPAYALLATSSVSGLVQHKGGHSLVRIHVGSSAPADATADYILIGSRGDLFRSFSWGGLTTGDKIYARSDDATLGATVTTVAA